MDRTTGRQANPSSCEDINRPLSATDRADSAFISAKYFQ